MTDITSEFISPLLLDISKGMILFEKMIFSLYFTFFVLSTTYTKIPPVSMVLLHHDKYMDLGVVIFT